MMQEGAAMSQAEHNIERAMRKSVIDSEDQRKRRLAEAIRKLQALSPFSGIPDPVAWQREIRKDRPLPGRDD